MKVSFTLPVAEAKDACACARRAKGCRMPAGDRQVRECHGLVHADRQRAAGPVGADRRDLDGSFLVFDGRAHPLELGHNGIRSLIDTGLDLRQDANPVRGIQESAAIIPGDAG